MPSDIAARLISLAAERARVSRSICSETVISSVIAIRPVKPVLPHWRHPTGRHRVCGTSMPMSSGQRARSASVGA